jgi:hypothetical protein
MKLSRSRVVTRQCEFTSRVTAVRRVAVTVDTTLHMPSGEMLTADYVRTQLSVMIMAAGVHNLDFNRPFSSPYFYNFQGHGDRLLKYLLSLIICEMLL